MLKFTCKHCNILPIPVAALSKEGSAAARLLGLWVGISPGAWTSVFYVRVCVVCCHVEVCTTRRSFV